MKSRIFLRHILQNNTVNGAMSITTNFVINQVI